MSDDGYPSMTALLGLLAIAGYQNRDKIAEMLGMGGHGTAVPQQSAPPQQAGGGGGLGGLLGGLLGGSGPAQSPGQGQAQGGGGFLDGGLGQLVDRFSQNGHGAVAQSWVSAGPNQPIGPSQLEQAIGPDVLNTLVQRTGLGRDELLSRLSKTLPQAVDQYTPTGFLPR